MYFPLPGFTDKIHGISRMIKESLVTWPLNHKKIFRFCVSLSVEKTKREGERDKSDVLNPAWSSSTEGPALPDDPRKFVYIIAQRAFTKFC